MLLINATNASCLGLTTSVLDAVKYSIVTLSCRLFRLKTGLMDAKQTIFGNCRFR